MTKNTLLKSRMGLTPPNWLLISLLLFMVNISVVKGQQTCSTALPVFIQGCSASQFVMPQDSSNYWLAFNPTSVNLKMRFYTANHLFDNNVSLNLFSGTCDSLTLLASSYANDTLNAINLDTNATYYIRLSKNIPDNIDVIIEKIDLSFCPSILVIEPSEYDYCCGETINLSITNVSNNEGGHNGCIAVYYSLLNCQDQTQTNWTYIGNAVFNYPNGAFSLSFTPPCIEGEEETQIFLGWSFLDIPSGISNPHQWCNDHYGQMCVNCNFHNCAPITLHQPIVTITADPNPICLGEFSSLTAHGASSYFWSNGFSVNPITVHPMTTTTYSVTGTDEYGCTGSSSVVVNVTDPKPEFSTFPNPLCLGDEVQFTDLSSCQVGISSWLWQFGDGSTSNLQNPTHTYLAPGNYVVYLTITNLNGHILSVHHNVKVSALPDAPIITGHFNDCDGLTQVYFISNYQPNYMQYKWSIDPASGIFLTSGSNIVVSTLDNQTITWSAPLTQPMPIVVTACNMKTQCCSTDTFYAYPCCTKTADINIINDDISSDLTITNKVVKIEGFCKVSASVIFDGCRILMGGGSVLEIDDNSNISIINSSTVMACSNYMWDGIHMIESNSYLKVENSTIKDAMNAVVSNNCAAYSITGSTFDLNYRNVIVKPCNQDFGGTIIGSTFKCSSPATMRFPHIGHRTFSGLEASKVNMIHIGQPLLLNNTNTFANLSSGIILTTTSAVICNNHFKNIQQMLGQPLNPAIQVSGSSNYTYGQPYLTIGGPAVEDGNTFTNCMYGINLKYGNKSIIQNNSFSSTSAPVYYAFCSNDAATYIINNTMVNATTAISAYRNNKSYNEITNNTIKWNGNGLPGTAIKVESVLSLSETFNISFNSITRARTGIFTNSLRNSIIRENDIKFETGSSLITAYGIHITGGEAMTVYGNIITGPAQAQNFSFGISISMCSKADVQCNVVEKCEQGLNFNGSMPSTVFRNTLRKNYYGLTLSNGGLIGPQGSMTYPSDNTWKLNSYDAWSFYSYGDQSPFFVRTSLPYPGNVAVFNPDFNPNYFSGTGFIALTKMLGANGNPIPCQLTSQGTSFQQSFMRKVVDNQIPYDLYPQSEAWEAKKGVFSILKSDSLLIYQADSVLSEFADSMRLSSIEMLENAIELYSANSIDSAQILNHLMQTTEFPEQNMKIVNNISFRDDSVALQYSPFEISELQFLASMCPYEYGPAVFVARSLLAPIDTTIYHNNCETFTSTIPDRSLTDETASPMDEFFELKMNPNPASNFVSVQINTQQQQSCHWQIISIDGKSVLLSGIVTSNTQDNIDVSMIENGVYLFAVNDDFGNSQTMRLVIIR